MQQTTPPGSSAEERSTSFRPVEGGANLQSGEKLLVEAYAILWIIVLAFVLLGWRRQRRIDERVAVLEAAVERARRAGPARADAQPDEAPGGEEHPAGRAD